MLGGLCCVLSSRAPYASVGHATWTPIMAPILHSAVTYALSRTAERLFL